MDPESTQTSVPILFDTKTKRVVSNESADLVRMFSMLGQTENGVAPQTSSPTSSIPSTAAPFDDSKLAEIEALNARIYQDVNNGAYRAGFSSDQSVHDNASRKYFAAFAWLNEILSQQKYLVAGLDTPSEADIRLFPTVFRHDPVYHSRMNLNMAMVRDYPHLNRWFLDMMALPGVQEASNLSHCIAGYFGRTGNRICPFVGMEHDGKRVY
eukprot:gnl/TRDRNA2_/TRDRNA2_70055_c1_seq1.p1 gnl/TRDRNA2_/TRDRNA2_70055_c1~~gnl/TRDRNA2_/TRDRNA2_70055_c1_seq1.p1  ORF type:complete len:211 (+),score=16.08 gnl/TRDRNA2_/TRDRNA2_70055_c1_seq1:1-633(+)